MERKLKHPQRTFRGLFEALGYALSDRGAHGFKAAREDRAFQLWVPVIPVEAPDRARLSTEILDEIEAHSSEAGARLALLPNLLALGPAFQTEVKARGGLIRTYGQFLDDEFKTDPAMILSASRDEEERRRARLVLDERGERAREKLSLLPETLRSQLDARGGVDPMQAKGPRRLPQPYRKIAGPVLGPGQDLLSDLVAHLDRPAGDDARPEVVARPGSDVFLVVGPAGVGKSEFLMRFTLTPIAVLSM